MTNTKKKSEKLASDNLTDDDKIMLLTLLDNLTKQKEAKAISAKKHMEKLKLDDDAMSKIRMQKMEYYLKNKDLIKDKERARYNNNLETRERKKGKSNLYYHNKFDNVPKKTRGRKPNILNNDDDDATTKIIRPRGRPRKHHIDEFTDE